MDLSDQTTGRGECSQDNHHRDAWDLAVGPWWGPEPPCVTKPQIAHQQLPEHAAQIDASDRNPGSRGGSSSTGFGGLNDQHTSQYQLQPPNLNLQVRVPRTSQQPLYPSLQSQADANMAHPRHDERATRSGGPMHDQPPTLNAWREQPTDWPQLWQRQHQQDDMVILPSMIISAQPTTHVRRSVTAHSLPPGMHPGAQQHHQQGPLHAQTFSPGANTNGWDSNSSGGADYFQDRFPRQAHTSQQLQRSTQSEQQMGPHRQDSCNSSFLQCLPGNHQQQHQQQPYIGLSLGADPPSHSPFPATQSLSAPSSFNQAFEHISPGGMMAPHIYPAQTAGLVLRPIKTAKQPAGARKVKGPAEKRPAAAAATRSNSGSRANRQPLAGLLGEASSMQARRALTGAGDSEAGLAGPSTSTDTAEAETEETGRRRSSQYRGVTKHRRSGRWEAHIWVKEIGRQVYLGGYEGEEHAAEAYDVAALKCKGIKVKTNFPVSRYTDLMACMDCISLDELIMAVRRQSQGFSRGSSLYRGVTAHPSGRWESRIGVPGSKHIYLGLFEEEKDAAAAYDMSLVRLRGSGAATNFGMADYRQELAEYHQMQQAVLLGDSRMACVSSNGPDFERWIKVGASAFPFITEAIEGKTGHPTGGLLPSPGAVGGGGVMMHPYMQAGPNHPSAAGQYSQDPHFTATANRMDFARAGSCQDLGPILNWEPRGGSSSMGGPPGPTNLISTDTINSLHALFLANTSQGSNSHTGVSGGRGGSDNGGGDGYFLPRFGLSLDPPHHLSHQMDSMDAFAALAGDFLQGSQLAKTPAPHVPVLTGNPVQALSGDSQPLAIPPTAGEDPSLPGLMKITGGEKPQGSRTQVANVAVPADSAGIAAVPVKVQAGVRVVEDVLVPVGVNVSGSGGSGAKDHTVTKESVWKSTGPAAFAAAAAAAAKESFLLNPLNR
ncbi:MAG: hypothetical protein WDW38_008244 [Sanguina aurantia]